MLNTSVWLFLLVNLTLNTLSQYALKAGANRLGSLDFSYSSLIHLLTAIPTSPFLMGGILFAIAAAIIWIAILSCVPVSIALPISSIGYVTSALVAYLFLNEQLTLLRILGTTVIVLGVIIVSRS